MEQEAGLPDDIDQASPVVGVARLSVGWRRHWEAGLVLLLGLLVTAGLTISSRTSYTNNEGRLTRLQTRLTAQLLQTAQPQLQATLGRVVGLAAAAVDPVSAFRAAIALELAPKGPYASAALAVVRDGRVQVLDHQGAPPITSAGSFQNEELYLTAARSSALITTRVVAGGVQRLGYLLSARGAAGAFVVGASQQLPVARRVTLPASSPVAVLNFALYFGPRTTPEALIETDSAHLPLTGTVAKATTPFGDNVLTLVASPKGSLEGKWSQYLPWGILGAGILLSLAGAGLIDRMARQRKTAESVGVANWELYRGQREVALSMQRALLPARLPVLPGFEAAARYVPAAEGAEIGGDWYSIVGVDEHKFAVVIGDVSGHGFSAAGTMASLRYTIRTLAKLGFSPDEILRRAHQEIDVGLDEHFATALVGLVDTRLNRLSLASAGHPPPLVIRDGGTDYIEIFPGAPLGIDGPPPELTTVTIAPRSTLVFFTDGLVERRGQSIDEGLERLVAVTAHGPSEPEPLIAHLLSALADDGHEDDIAVLAIRFSEQAAERPVGASWGSPTDAGRS